MSAYEELKKLTPLERYSYLFHRLTSIDEAGFNGRFNTLMDDELTAYAAGCSDNRKLRRIKELKELLNPDGDITLGIDELKTRGFDEKKFFADVYRIVKE